MLAWQRTCMQTAAALFLLRVSLIYILSTIGIQSFDIHVGGCCVVDPLR